MHDIAPIRSRFKIDLSRTPLFECAVYCRRWYGWKHVNWFHSVKEAKAFVEEIKDLPEYLP